MTKRISPTERTQPIIRDIGPAQPELDPGEVAKALGSEAGGVTLEDVFAPITLLAVREELFNRLQSTGGRPALAGTTKTAKVPLREKDWEELEKAAKMISLEGMTPSAGQLASVLVTLSMKSLSIYLSGAGASGSSVASQLAALATQREAGEE